MDINMREPVPSFITFIILLSLWSNPECMAQENKENGKFDFRRENERETVCWLILVSAFAGVVAICYPVFLSK